MNIHNAGFRRSVGLDKQLHARLDERCELKSCSTENLPDTKADAGFQAQLCHRFGVCVCTQYPDALNVFHNLSSYFRSAFWKKKKTKQASAARKLLEQRSIFVRFSPRSAFNHQDAIPLTDRQSLQGPEVAADNDFDQMYEQVISDALEADSSPARATVFAHIGHINFQSWHFSCLQVHPVEPLCMPDTPPAQMRPSHVDVPLVALVHVETSQAAGQQLGVFTDMELIAKRLDPTCPWVATILAVSGCESHWPAAPDTAVPLVHISGVEDFVFWHGSQAEAGRRDQAKKKRSATQGQAQPCRGAKRRKQKARPRTKARSQKKRREPEEDDLELHFLEDYDSDPAFAPLDGEEGVPSEATSASQDSLEELLADLEVARQEAEAPSPHESDLSSVASGDVELDPVFDYEVGAPGAEQAPVAAEHQPAAASARPDDAGAQPPPAEPAAEPAALRPRAAGGTRSNLHTTVFTVPGGEIHYNALTEQMQAFCGLRACQHYPDCRKTATTNPKKRGSGRPIGLLMSWLQQAESYDDKLSHVHSCRPTWDQRKEARAIFQTLEGWESFAAFEKTAEGNNLDEPAAP